jgi:CBS domain containing-hemolysin-like protein
MIPLEKAFMLEANEKLDGALVDKILSQNYSKFLIY